MAPNFTVYLSKLYLKKLKFLLLTRGKCILAKIMRICFWVIAFTSCLLRLRDKAKTNISPHLGIYLYLETPSWDIIIYTSPIYFAVQYILIIILSGDTLCSPVYGSNSLNETSLNIYRYNVQSNRLMNDPCSTIVFSNRALYWTFQYP